jgi:hypothetical protein
MNPMISVNDLASGTVSVRPSDTRTLDIPAGFDRRTPVASLDFHSRVQCASTDGGLLRYLAFTSPLSSRAQGEECLVADGPFRATVPHPSSYRLSALSEKDATGPRFAALAEVLAAHPESPDGCVCGGSGEIEILRNGKLGTGYCPHALDELRRRSGFDIADTPLDPQWFDVADPDNWAFRQMFAASMLRLAQEDELRRIYPISRFAIPALRHAFRS